MGVPGAVGLTGNLVAAALGAVAGDPEKGLESLSGVTKEDVASAQALLQQDQVAEKVVDDVPDVYVEAEVFDGADKVAAIISGRHDHLAEVRKKRGADFHLQKRCFGVSRPAGLYGRIYENGHERLLGNEFANGCRHHDLSARRR